MSGRNAKGRHEALMSDLDEAAAPVPSTSSAPAPVGKPNPDNSVPTLAKTGELLRTELQTARAKVDALQMEVDELRLAPAERKIPARLIAHGRFRDRHELGFSDAAFQALKASIQAERGNTQPVLVRPLAKPDAEGCKYEVVWGHRRHRACLESDLDVNTIVRDLTDREAVALMTIENKLRTDLSQFELARKYKVWLDEGLFESQQAIADKEGLNQATISRIMAINELPAEIVARIEDPRKVSGKWASDVLGLMKRDRDGVMTRLADVAGQVSPKALLKLLDRVDELPAPKDVLAGKRPIFQATAGRGPGGDVVWSGLKLYEPLDEVQLEKLAAFIAKL
jgi:ParB family chromosome partitioning protein